MPPHSAFLLLTALIVAPALGSLGAASAARRPRWASALALGAAALTLALAAWSAWSFLHDGPLRTAPYPWIASLGVSFVLGGDALSSVFSAWIALSVLVILACSRPEPRAAAVVLFLEAATLGLLLSQDAFLSVSFLGAIAVASALMAREPAKVLGYQMASLALWLCWFAHVYRMIYEQTGFVSTDLARWRALVLYPNEELRLFALVAAATGLGLLPLSVALASASRSGRLALLTSFGVIAGHLLLRIVVPLNPRGAAALSSVMLAAAIVLMVYAGFARDWNRFALGYFGLVLYGLFSFRETAVAGAELLMVGAAAGLLGLMLSNAKALDWFFTSFLLGLPVVAVLLPSFVNAPVWAALATAGFLLLSYRLIVLVRHENEDRATPGRSALAVPLAAWCLSMVIGWAWWQEQVLPSARSLIEKVEWVPEPEDPC